MRRMREEVFLLLRRVRKYEKRHWRNLSLGLFPLSIEPVSVSFNLFHNTLFLEEFMPFYTAVSLLISEYFFFLWKFKPLYPFPHLDLITLVIVSRLVLLPQVFVQMLNEFVWIDGELVELPFMRTWEIFEPLDIWWVRVGYLVGHSADLSKIVVNCTFDLMLLWPLTNTISLLFHHHLHHLQCLTSGCLYCLRSPSPPSPPSPPLPSSPLSTPPPPSSSSDTSRDLMSIGMRCPVGAFSSPFYSTSWAGVRTQSVGETSPPFAPL